MENYRCLGCSNVNIHTRYVGMNFDGREKVAPRSEVIEWWLISLFLGLKIYNSISTKQADDPYFCK